MTKKKWKNLRDTYIKKKKENKGRSGDPATKSKEWKYEKIMDFLDPYISNPRYSKSQHKSNSSHVRLMHDTTSIMIPLDQKFRPFLA